jgi:hypothetical protein
MKVCSYHSTKHIAHHTERQKKIAIPTPISPDNTIIRPAIRDAKITTASIRIPLIGELNKGTSDMPLNRV